MRHVGKAQEDERFKWAVSQEAEQRCLSIGLPRPQGDEAEQETGSTVGFV